MYGDFHFLSLSLSLCPSTHLKQQRLFGTLEVEGIDSKQYSLCLAMLAFFRCW